MKIRKVYVIDSMKELAQLADGCYYENCVKCRYRKTCIDKNYLWFYEGFLEYTPYQLYEKTCLREV